MPSKKSKKKQRSSPQPKKATESTAAAESRAAEAATVAWMLSLMATLLAEAVGMLARWYAVFVENVDMIWVFSFVMLFVALLAGVVTLVLTPVVLKISRRRPPAIIVQVAIVAGVLPLLAVALQYLKG